jgi:Cu/Ag efflux pump CusA
VLIAVAGAAVVGLAMLPLLGTSVIPSFKDRDVLVRLDAEPGTSNPRMTRIATKVSRQLRSLDGVAEVGAHVGRAVTGDQIGDVNSAEVWVSIDSDADYDATLASIEDKVDSVRSVAQKHVGTYSSQRIRDVGGLRDGDSPLTGDGLDVLTGSGRPLVVRVYGQDQRVLLGEASRVRRLVSQVDGVVDPRIALPATQPTLQIEVDLDKAQTKGIKPGDVRRAEAALLQGIQVGSVFEEQKVFDVIVQGVPETRESPASIRNLLLDRPDGGHVRLGSVAEVRTARTPISIRRDAVSRYVDVEARVSGRGLSAVASDVEDRLASTSFPLEYHAEALQETSAEEINATKMLAFAVAAAIAAFLLLQAALGSWRLAALAFGALPIALVGGIPAALVDGAELSLGSLIAFLALFGVAARMGIVLLRGFQELESAGESFGAALVERGARERLRPILASASGTAAVMLPFAIAGAMPGLEIVHPLAIVMLGGLVTSLLVSLFVLPALYLQLGAGVAEPDVSPDDELLRRWAGVKPEPETVEPAGT